MKTRLSRVFEARFLLPVWDKYLAALCDRISADFFSGPGASVMFFSLSVAPADQWLMQPPWLLLLPVWRRRRAHAPWHRKSVDTVCRIWLISWPEQKRNRVLEWLDRRRTSVRRLRRFISRAPAPPASSSSSNYWRMHYCYSYHDFIADSLQLQLTLCHKGRLVLTNLRWHSPGSHLL